MISTFGMKILAYHNPIRAFLFKIRKDVLAARLCLARLSKKALFLLNNFIDNQLRYMYTTKQLAYAFE